MYNEQVYAFDKHPRPTAQKLKIKGTIGEASSHLNAIYVKGTTRRYNVPFIILGLFILPVAWQPAIAIKDIPEKTLNIRVHTVNCAVHVGTFLSQSFNTKSMFIIKGNDKNSNRAKTTFEPLQINLKVRL